MNGYLYKIKSIYIGYEYLIMKKYTYRSRSLKYDPIENLYKVAMKYAIHNLFLF